MAVTLGGLAAIAGGAAALNTVGSAVFGNINNKRAKSMAALNDRYQRQLLEDVPSLNKKGLQKAGLSVSALNGNAFNSVSSNSSAAAPEMTAPQVDTGQLLQMATLPDQKKLLKEQVKGVELDNSKKALENDIASNKAKLYGKMALDYGSKSFDDEGIEKDAQLLDNVDIVAAAPEPRPMDYEAYQVVTGNKRLQDESERGGFSYNITHSKLMKTIEDNQLLDKRLINKMSNMPAKQYDRLVEDIANIQKKNRELNNENWFFHQVKNYRIQCEKYGADKAKIDYELFAYQFKQTKNFDFRNFVSNLVDGEDWSWKDAVKVLVAVAASRAGIN